MGPDGPVARIEHFSGLREADRRALLEGSRVRTYAAGDAILIADTPPEGFAFLLEGEWTMRRVVPGGDEPVIWTDSRPGNRHGGTTLMDAIAPPEVHATTQSTVLHVPRGVLERLAARDATLARMMLRGVAGGATLLQTAYEDEMR
jgi:signal-transduction protein with cAMP-binding, CBS, and nucleotidyltransferase domain